MANANPRETPNALHKMLAMSNENWLRSRGHGCDSCIFSSPLLCKITLALTGPWVYSRSQRFAFCCRWHGTGWGFCCAGNSGKIRSIWQNRNAPGSVLRPVKSSANGIVPGCLARFFIPLNIYDYSAQQIKWGTMVAIIPWIVHPQDASWFNITIQFNAN